MYDPKRKARIFFLYLFLVSIETHLHCSLRTQFPPDCYKTQNKYTALQWKQCSNLTFEGNGEMENVRFSRMCST